MNISLVSRGLVSLWVTSVVGACVTDQGYTLSEEEGGGIIRGELEARGYTPSVLDHLIEEISVEGGPACPAAGGACGTPVSFVLDGWDEGAAVGFEYIAAGDPDFSDRPELTTAPMIDMREAVAALERSVNATLGEGGVVIVMRRWAHETAYLAAESFRDRVREELDALGLSGPDL